MENQRLEKSQTNNNHSLGNIAENYLFKRFYTQEGKNVYDMFEYELKTAEIRDKDLKIKFYQENVEVPTEWSDTATKIVASKYFKRKGVKKEYGGNQNGSEQSAKNLINRVSNTIKKWGEEGKYFTSKEEADSFQNELSYILLSQKAAFNSPVWFNLGLFHEYGIIENGECFYWNKETNQINKGNDSYSHPQCSACFINSIEDTMFGDHGPDDHSIFKLIETEAKLFKYGSGNGTNFSSIRAKGEPLSGGGESSGLVDFLKILDAGANAVKSGGKTRRAAKMVILNADHPDIEELIDWKVESERKARALASHGYDTNMDGLYKDLFGQNSNNSVRVTNDFMNAIALEGYWNLTERVTGIIRNMVKAKDLFEHIVKAAWVSGDPGMQFDTTINDWHTCKNSGRINASNPCSEYMFLDNTACNLASINLMKFRNSDGTFNKEEFKHVVDIIIAAQEIIVDGAGYPTYSIAQNSHDFRPLGLGYANLGAYLMSNGISYDSEEAFSIAGAITAIMTGRAYEQSAKIASRIGPFPRFDENREPFLEVMKKHRDHVDKIPKLKSRINLEELIEDAEKEWSDVLNLVNEYGVRNSQSTVIAPTGTIAFMMDCDTTGIEPDIALVKYKTLAGKAGYLKLINNTIPLALSTLGYNELQIKDIQTYLNKTDTIEGAPHLKEEHLSIFDCAFKPANGIRSISPIGHVKMMAAVQPFISGAISKTVDMPEEAGPIDIYNIYFEAWKMELKAISIYRDGSKLSQPLSVGKSNLENKLLRGQERHLPQITESVTIRTKIKDEIGMEHGLHIICGEYEDGTLGEIRAQMFDQASTIQGFLNSLTVAWSKELRYGAPLKKLITANRKSKFEPSGISNYSYIRSFDSIPNLIMGIVGLEYLGVDGYIEVTGEDFIKDKVKDPSKLRINKNIERLRYEYYSEQIKEMDAVMKNSLNFDNKDDKNINKQKIAEIEYSTEVKIKSNGEICPDCGSMVIIKGGCTHCSNCGSQLGGGCPS